ncbi:MAG: hypothetical protein JWN72_1536 [Thermoleophilia bacterium]|nr:hypothetical protein [Thermoleophilia bacterium]
MDAPQESLDRLADLAARVVGAPVGLVALVDVDRSYFVGMEAPEGTPRNVELTHSYCKHVVLDDAPVVIEDARTDARFHDNLAIRDFGVVAYLGVPVRDLSGSVLGSLCVMDVVPHAWTPEHVGLLEDIALAVVAEIEMRTLLAERDGALEYQTHARARVEVERGRYMLLTHVGDITSSVEDPAMLSQLIAQAAVPDTCDWCIVELAPTPDAREPIVGIGAATDELRAQVEEMRAVARAWPGWRSPTLLAFEHRAPRLLPDASLADLVEPGHLDDVPPRLQELVESTGLRVISAVPLAARGRIIGAVSFIRRSVALGFDEAEQALHHEIARRAALAIDAARMRIDLEQRAQAALVIETIGEGVVLLDADRRVQLWNPAMATMTGICASNARGRALDDIAPELTEFVTAAVQPDAVERHVSIGEADAQRWLAVTAVQFEGGSVLALRDMTAAHALEQTRHELIATVSHQLRTPVASVLAAAITLQRTDIELSAEVTSQVIDTIVEQGQRLSDLSADVLLAYRLGNEAHQVGELDIDVAPLLTEVAQAARHGLGPEHVLELQLGTDLPKVVGDEHALVQVFGNLVDNALKYSPDGGTVTIHARVEGGEVHIHVDDEGVGIPEAERHRVFERFYRLDPDMARVAGGTGLGLFVARELVHLMGGRVLVAARPRGTRFTVALQRA